MGADKYGDTLSGMQATSKLPALAMYDFANAFPTLVHAWLFKVIRALQLPLALQWIVYWMYIESNAYSSGVGDGRN